MLNIRPYSSNDFDAVMELFYLNTPEYFAPDEENDLIHYLETEIEFYFVAEKDTMIVGAGGYNLKAEPDTARISWDMIHPDYQGQGIGSQLVQHRLKEIGSLPSIQRIIVRTSQYAQDFYSRNNFEVLETQPDYWAPGFDLVLMHLKK